MKLTSSSVRLFCFPYAGSSSVVYARWKRRVPEWLEVVPVEWPGRGRRMAEPLATSMAELLEAVARELPDPAGRPFAFFGHSLGALVAFEFAHYLQERHMDLPLVVFASGTHAPARREPERFAALRSDEELRAELERLDGTPRSALDNPELMALTLPVLRADFEIAGSYTCAARRSIRSPIHAFGGTEDEPTSETLLAWKEHTIGDFWLNMLPGGHFFLHDQEAQLLRLLQLRLQALLSPSRPLRSEVDPSAYALGLNLR